MGKQRHDKRSAAGQRSGGQARDLPDFSHLPERVPPEDLTTTQDVDPGPDPRGGRNPERDYMLRYGAGL